MGWIQACALLCLLAAARAQNGIARGLNPLGRPILADDVIGDEIPGEAGIDYPVLATVPRTDFRCDQLPYPGYYADQQAYCQVFYICEKGGRGTGFLCPNGTLFNQEYLVCDWWNKVDCARATDYYSVNEAIVRAMEKVDAANLGRSPQDGAFFNSRGEPLSAARIPGGSSSNYNPLGLDRPLVSPSRLGNRYPTSARFPTQNNFGRVPNAALLNATPRPVSGFPNAFDNFRSQNQLGAYNNNRYPYSPQGTVGAFNNRTPLRPVNTPGALNNRYPYSPQSALDTFNNNRYPYRPQGTVGAFNNRAPFRPVNTPGAFNNRYPYRPQGTVGAQNNGYTYRPQGSPFNDGSNSVGSRYNNAIGNNNGNKDNERYGNGNGKYNRANENGNRVNEGPDTGRFSNGNGNVVNEGQNSGRYANGNGNVANEGQNSGRYSNGNGNVANGGENSGRYPNGNGNVANEGQNSGRYPNGNGNVANEGQNSGRYPNGNGNVVNEGQNSGRYSNGNGNVANEGQNSGRYSNGNSNGVNDAGRTQADKQPGGNNGTDNGKAREYNNSGKDSESNGVDQDKERYRDGKGKPGFDEGYFYDHPDNGLKEGGKYFGLVDPSRSYLPPLK